jgi:hypothetical protein
MSLGPFGRKDPPHCSAFTRETAALVERTRVLSISRKMLSKNDENELAEREGVLEMAFHPLAGFRQSSPSLSDSAR